MAATATFPLMGKKKTAKTYERARDRGEVSYIGAEIDLDLRAAVEAYSDEHGSSLRFIIESGLKCFLEKKGFWPPPADPK